MDALGVATTAIEVIGSVLAVVQWALNAVGSPAHRFRALMALPLMTAVAAGALAATVFVAESQISVSAATTASAPSSESSQP